MTIMETINFILTVLFGVFFTAVVIYILLPDDVKAIYLKIIFGVIDSITEFANIANLFADAAIVLMHAIGKYLIVGAFLVAALILTNNIFSIYGVELIGVNSEIKPLIEYFKSKESWVPVTALLATIVAFGHFRNLKHTLTKD